MKTFEPDLDLSGRNLRALALLTMAAALAYYTYRVSAAPGMWPALLALWVFLLVAGSVALLWWMPARLRYELTDEALEIQTAFGRRRILLENLRAVEPVEYALGRRSGSAALPGYYVGRFQSSLGKLTAYAGRPAGEGLLLLLHTGEMVLLTPKQSGLLRERLRRLLPPATEVEDDEPQK